MTWIFSGSLAGSTLAAGAGTAAAGTAAAGTGAALGAGTAAGLGAGAGAAGAAGAGGLTAAELAAQSAPAIAEGASAAAPAATAAAPAAETGGIGINEALSPFDLKQPELPGAPKPSFGVLENSLFADKPIPKAAPAGEVPPPWKFQPEAGKYNLLAEPSGMDWEKARDYMKGAYYATRMASKLIPNKSAKQTLNLMAMGTGMGAGGGDMSKTPDLVMGPLNDIAQTTQQNEAQKQKGLNAALSPLAPTPVPSSTMQPMGGPVSPTRSTSLAASSLPPVRLTSPDDFATLSPQDRLRRLYGG